MIVYYTDGFKGGRTESRRLLEEALSEYTGDAAKAKMLVREIRTGEKGKPYIDGFEYFSVSHTGSIWAVLIAACECGLDIQIERKCNAAAIAKRIFAPEDAKAVSALFTTSENHEFFRLWTRREALIKAMGGSVCDAGLPSVMQNELVINGKDYLLMDVDFPDISNLPDSPDLYSAVCLAGKMPASPEFRRI